MSLKYLFIALFVTVAYSKTFRQNEDAKAALEKYIAEAKEKVNPRYRLTYHVAPPVGWMNDPNGFGYYNGSYHLFYQFYPYDSVWGPMHWGHFVSPDLINWETLPTALLPDEEQCFSGSAVVKDDTLYLMYTGHVLTETGYYQHQYLAYSDDGINFDKYPGNPVLAFEPDNSPEFRDPKVWKHGDHWYVILGSQTEDTRGRVLLYRSKDLFVWEFLNILGESDGSMGYMWECPDFFELDGKHILLMSPQGIQPQGDRYKNLHQTGYYVGNFSYETFEFTPITEFQELDYGHDFYATQTTEADGRRVVIGWFGMWEVPHPEAADGWAGAMTMIRELRLDSDNRIIMNPLPEMVTLRDGTIKNGILFPNESLSLGKAAEIILELNLEQDIDLQFNGKEGGEKFWLHWSEKNGKVSLVREGDNVRRVEWNPGSLKQWRIFLDTSSVELFCGDGEVVFSSRVYPLGGWEFTNLSNQTFQTVAYSLKRSVPV